MRRNQMRKVGRRVLEAAERGIRRKEKMYGGRYFLNYEREVIECLAAYIHSKNDPKITERGVKAAYWIGENDEIHQTAGAYYLPALEIKTRETKKKGGDRHVFRKRPGRKNKGVQPR